MAQIKNKQLSETYKSIIQCYHFFFPDFENSLIEYLVALPGLYRKPPTHRLFIQPESTHMLE